MDDKFEKTDAEIVPHEHAAEEHTAEESSAEAHPLEGETADESPAQASVTEGQPMDESPAQTRVTEGPSPEEQAPAPEAQAPEEQAEKPKTKKAKSRLRRRGYRAAAISAAVIVVVVAINLVLGLLPTGALEYDLTDSQIYTISDLSKNYLATLTHDVQIILFAQPGNIDQRVLKALNDYAKLSSHITVQQVDPLLSPGELEQYNAQENTVLVTCPDTGRSQTINLVGFSGQSQGLILYDYQSYETDGSMYPVQLNVEGSITSAIAYVVNGVNDTMYVLTGHGEPDLGTDAASSLSQANISTQSLDLMKDGAVPSDCELIFINNPQTDLSDDEYTLLSSYLDSGGHVMIMLDNPLLPNFNKILANYGLEMNQGYIADTDRYYKSYASQFGYYCIYPVLSTTDPITSGVSGDALLLLSRGMTEVTPVHSNSSVSEFMTTSDNGLNVIDSNNQTQGQYIIGAVATEDSATSDNSDAEARLTVISCALMIDQQITSQVPSAANLEIFTNAVALNFSDQPAVTIQPKSLTLQYNTIKSATIWGVIMIGLLPVAFLVTGIAVRVRRRKR